MKQREQALLLIKKALQDEALLTEILPSPSIRDEILGSIASRPQRNY